MYKSSLLVTLGRITESTVVEVPQKDNLRFTSKSLN